MKIIYFGTPVFAAKVLTYLLENGVNISAVITKPDKAKGRSNELVPTPVKQVALAHQLPVYQPEIVSDPAFAPTLEAYQADLFVVVAYGEIIKQHLLDMPQKGCINVHASLLPKWRGAAPIQRSIIHGDHKSGVTIMYMVRKMDAGDMIKTVEVPIGPNTTFGQLEEALCEAGKHALLEVIRSLEKGPVNRTPQNHEEMTLAPKIELEDCEINWENSAQDIHNLIRGVNPYPGAWCFVSVKGDKKRLKIYTSELLSENVPPKKIKADKKGLIAGCGTHSLRLVDVQLEGKKAMTSAELLRGISIDNIELC
jgi:methionyl-tRNA formyltransferase